MSRPVRILCLAALAAICAWPQTARLSREPNRLAPYVNSPYTMVDRMLDVAALKPGETLYDLGCGDGRILVAAVQKYRAKAVGVELSPRVAKDARDNLQKNNVQDMASVVEGDLMKVDLSPADVVTVYLTTEFNQELRPNLEKYLHPGARVISFEYPIPGWKPQRKETTDLYNHKHTIYVYTMPPQK